jgi:integrase
VASSYIVRRANGRWEVRFRLGGRESRIRYGGKFATLREARARRDWIAGELSAQRVPDIYSLAAADRAAPTLTVAGAAEAWRASRLDVAAGTDATYSVSLGRIIPRLGKLQLDRLDVRRVSQFVAELHEQGLARESIRKTLGVLAMIFDHAGVSPAVPLFSPHDLRHRRISLLHLGGVPWARIGEAMGQRSLAVTADTYTHVLIDERELDYAALLAAS